MRTTSRGDIVFLNELNIRSVENEFIFFVTSNEIDSRDGSIRPYTGGCEDATNAVKEQLTLEEFELFKSMITRVYCSLPTV